MRGILWVKGAAAEAPCPNTCGKLAALQRPTCIVHAVQGPSDMIPGKACANALASFPGTAARLWHLLYHPDGRGNSVVGSSLCHCNFRAHHA